MKIRKVTKTIRNINVHFKLSICFLLSTTKLFKSWLFEGRRSIVLDFTHKIIILNDLTADGRHTAAVQHTSFLQTKTIQVRGKSHQAALIEVFARLLGKIFSFCSLFCQTCFSTLSWQRCKLSVFSLSVLSENGRENKKSVACCWLIA